MYIKERFPPSLDKWGLYFEEKKGKRRGGRWVEREEEEGLDDGL
jgi:regulator of RNase E activity RraB